VIKADQIVVTF